ncbi:multicopper oxidase domain-containing protein [Candidatus Nitrosocosmicus arcticus]|nr:multicopper oxidase domain-containing protein [Candidatus Nitrosocosmicus arcticus]
MSCILSINPAFTTSEPGDLEEGVSGRSNEIGNEVLQTTIIASKQESKLANQSIPTMVYNGSLVGPTLLASPGDQIELKLVNSLDEPTNLHFHGLHVSPSNNSDNVFCQVLGKLQTILFKFPVTIH